MAHSLNTINQKLLRPEDWILSTVPNSQEKFAELLTMNILIIGAVLFNTLMQQVSQAKNMEIFSISIRNIEKTLAPKSTTNLVKKPPTKYYHFLDVFFRADFDILLLHRPYDHKISLMKDKTSP